MQLERVVFYTVCEPKGDNPRSLAVLKAMKEMRGLPPNWSFKVFASPEYVAGNISGSSVAFFDGLCKKSRNYSPTRPQKGLAQWAELATTVIMVGYKCNIDRCARQIAGVVSKRGVDSWGPKADAMVRRARRRRIRAKQEAKAGPIYIHTRPYFAETKFT